MLTALSAGVTKEVPELSLLRVPFTSLTGVNDAMLRDFRTCSRLFDGCGALPCFRTALSWETCPLTLPPRAAFSAGEQAELLPDALRGRDMPFSYPTDPEAAEWALSHLLEEESEQILPFLKLRDRLREELQAGEEIRLMLLCDPCSGLAAGAAAALLRFFRAGFGERAPFLGLFLIPEPTGPAAAELTGAAAEFLRSLSRRNLVRAADDRPSAGADAAWLLSLPASLGPTPDSRRPVRFALARALAESFTGKTPSAGIHTRELPAVLSLSALGEEANTAAAAIRAAVWSLCDILPALRQYFDHPVLLRSLAPASRNGLFRRLFRQGDQAGMPEEFQVVERVLKVMLLELLSLIRDLPEPLREAEKASALWQEAVRACGRVVTVASEYDVSRREARDSGVDRVAPVHRVSMADTEEEQMLRKLDDLAAELADARAAREGVFEKIGGYRARQALEDCLSRCLEAERSAKDKLSSMPSDTPEERFALALQERRVRLLGAAVARCEQDIAKIKSPEALSRPAEGRPEAPWSGEILESAHAEQLFTLLTGDGAAAEEAARALRDHMDTLLSRPEGQQDVKALLKSLLSACRGKEESGAPLRTLLCGIFSACLAECAPLRFSPLTELPSVALLPDMEGTERFLTVSEMGRSMLAPPRPDRTAFLRGLLALLLLRQYRRRGAEEASLSIRVCRPEDSPLSRVWLSSRGTDRAWIVSLVRNEHEEDEIRLPFAVLLPGRLPEAAFLTKAHHALIPAFCVWYRPEERVFEDPCPYLSEGDRSILTELFTRLRSLLKDPRSRELSAFLSDWHRDLMQSHPADREDPQFEIRLKAACALVRLPAWKKDLSRLSSFFERSLGEDPLCACLSGEDQPFPAAACAAPDDILYTFRGTPFARESSQRLLESPCLPGESALLSSLNAECEILSHSSDDYHEALIAGLTDLLARCPKAAPSARETAERLLEKAKEPVEEQVTELTWPWDTVSASVLTILNECLGKELGAAALHPFSDALALFPARGGEIIGDALLSRMCVIGPKEEAPSAAEKAEEKASGENAFGENASGENAFGENAPGDIARGESAEQPPESPRIPADAVLPPLSLPFASALCGLSEGRTLLQEGFLTFSRESGGIRSVMTLEGAFTLKLVRLWREEEIVSLYTHDMPTLALWPALPLPKDLWHVYYVYAHLTEGFRFTVCAEDGEIRDLEGGAPRCAGCFPAFPRCFALLKEDRCLGALPNLLPPPELPVSGDWTACLDFGSAASSVVFSAEDSRWPLQGAGLVRCLLRCPSASEELLWREFMPAVPLAPILPGALRIFRNTPFASGSAESPVPFRDGSIFLSASLRDVLEVPPEALYTDLKWNEEKGRASGLYLHQLMLLCALQARCGGASSLGWRAAVPDEMAPGGREKLTEMLTELALRVSRESGLPLPPKAAPASFAPESSALGAYFRLCSPEETRGGFLLLDLGADTADISLFLRGRDAAVRSCQLPLGIHYMLLPSLLRRPAILTEDFSFLPDPVFQQNLASLRSVLENARTSAAHLRQARYALDAFIADYAETLHDALLQRMNGNAPGRTGALLLLHFSYLMMLTGLVLLQVAGDPGRNDFLPERMSLCLSGRGAGLIESLTPRVKTSLWKILTMFRNPRVSSLSLLFSAEKKLEIPVGLSCLSEVRSGLPQAAPVPVTISVRPEELLPEFLNRFRREFPAEAQLLFPHLYSQDPWHPFTPWGMETISGALRSAFSREESAAVPRPYSALSACIGLLLEMSSEAPPQPEGRKDSL